MTIGHVCAVAVAAVGVDSAAVAVTLPATPRETLHASDRIASDLEELALTLGDGPESTRSPTARPWSRT